MNHTRLAYLLLNQDMEVKDECSRYSEKTNRGQKSRSEKCFLSKEHHRGIHSQQQNFCSIRSLLGSASLQCCPFVIHGNGNPWGLRRAKGAAVAPHAGPHTPDPLPCSARGRGGTASAAPAASTDLPRLSNKSPQQLPLETRGPQQGQITANHPHGGPRPGEAFLRDRPSPRPRPRRTEAKPAPAPRGPPRVTHTSILLREEIWAVVRAFLLGAKRRRRRREPRTSAGQGRREGGRQDGGETKRTG